MISGFRGAIGTTGIALIAMAALAWLLLPLGHPVYRALVPPLVLGGLVYARIRSRGAKQPSIGQPRDHD